LILLVPLTTPIQHSTCYTRFISPPLTANLITATMVTIIGVAPSKIFAFPPLLPVSPPSPRVLHYNEFVDG
jgi:hypothetical protein